MVQKIDAHHHLWQYDIENYGWIDQRMGVLARDFLPPDLDKELRSAGIDGAVAVLAQQTLSETAWLLGLADQFSFIHGVVGWAPLASEDFSTHLNHLQSHRKLKGVPHIIQSEPDDSFILNATFNRGIACLKDTGLVYDILILERHLPRAIQSLDRHPQQKFVLDHIAKPRIRKCVMDPWRRNIAELAKRENVHCKVSGMVTEADWSSWSKQDLWPYLDVVLEAFGPQRLMAGSDWPVCLLAASYPRWFELLNGFSRETYRSREGADFGRHRKRSLQPVASPRPQNTNSEW